MMKVLRSVAFALVAGVGLLALSGCADMGKMQELQAQAHELRADLAQDHARWQAAVDALPPDDPDRGVAEAGLAVSQAKLSAIDAATKQLDEAIRTASNPDDPITRTLGWVTPWVPAPWRTPIVLGGALLATFARAWQFKKAAASIAEGINVAMSQDEQFQASFKQHASTFRLAQTRTAAKIVDRLASGRS